MDTEDASSDRGQAVDALVDEAYDLYVALDDVTPLWTADLDHIERWVSTSREHTDDVRRRAESMIDRIEQAVRGADEGLRVSLLTVAALLRQSAACVDVHAERTFPGPMGLMPLLHAAVPSYALTTSEHGERYREKLRRFPAAVDELRTRLETSAGAGRVQTSRNARSTVTAIDRLLSTDLSDDPMALQSAPAQLDAEAAAAFRDDLLDLVAGHTRPALARLRDTLREVSIPAGADDDHPGLLHLPGGEQEYAEVLGSYTQPRTSPEQVHQTGLAQLERLEQEWATIGHSAFGISDPAEVRRRVAAVPGPQSAEEVRRDATAVLSLATERAPHWFNRVPRSSCEVKLVRTGAIAYYRPPSEDGSLPGYTHLNVTDLSTWATELAVTTVHEGIPGHHYQMALALEDDSLDRCHRRVYLPAYCEGWALYAERIGERMGLYPDPLDQLGMLVTDALRAARMVIDTGLHAFGWTREQGVKFLEERAGLGRPDAEAEVDRFISEPGQAASYMHGRLAIEAARDRAKQRLGNSFDIRAFHDVVLSHGTVSLDALDGLVDNWIAATT